MCTFLVFLVDNYVFPAWNKFLLNFVSKVIIYVAESENSLVDFVIFEPLHRLIELVILSLEIVKLQLLSYYCLIESSSEIRVYEFTLN